MRIRIRAEEKIVNLNFFDNPIVNGSRLRRVPLLSPSVPSTGTQSVIFTFFSLLDKFEHKYETLAEDLNPFKRASSQI
jgi:hypothetical protein